MARPTLYVAITNHGFGHATRTAAAVEAIQQKCPDLLVIVTTAAPRWLLESYITGDFIYRPRAFDIGVIQCDCLTMDKSATLSHLYDIRTRQAELIASEVTFIQQNGVGLILADIPPLMGLIAQTAKIPCWMLGNFGWDFIYRAWGDDYHEMADWISDCFGLCDRLFRLPFHEPMKAFPTLEDVGFVGGSPHFSMAHLRDTFQIQAPREQTAMITFGGLNLQQIPYEGLRQYPDWQFITFDLQAPDLPNLCKIHDRRYRPVDFMPLCGRIISKPGYGTFAEACRTGTGVVSLEREDFAEAEILLSGIREYAPHQILPPADFYAGTWDFLNADLTPPSRSEAEIVDGNTTIAEAIAAFWS